MTFEQFQATRRHVTDISTETGVDVGENMPGHVYDGGLHIFDYTASEHQLQIMGEEWISDDIAELERRLYDFASGEGLMD